MSAATIKPSFQPLRGNTILELQLAIQRLGPRLRRAARTIANGDADLAEDFYQAAITELWELDPARFDDDDAGFLWRALVNRMLKSRRDNEEGDPTRPPLALRFR
jgi:DNA-directed RNA polymerase specialized sigma24 family protein